MQREEWETYTRFLGLFIASGYVKNATPLSLLLVGEPGVGKSQLIDRFSDVQATCRVMDLTSDGMKHRLFPTMVRNGKRIILFPDFAKMFQRNAPTAENALGVLTQAMSGELHEMFVGNQESVMFKDFQVGVVGAMPTQVYYNWKRTAISTGIQDRFTILPVAFSLEQRAAIEYAIAVDDTSMTCHVPWKWPDRPVVIRKPSNLGAQIIQLADDIQPSGERNRLVMRLKVLYQCAALLNGNDFAGRLELEQVRDFLPLLKAMR